MWSVSHLFQTLMIDIISSFAFFILLLMDCPWPTALVLAATLAFLVCLIYYYLYLRRYVNSKIGLISYMSLLLGFWIVCYVINRTSYAYPTAQAANSASTVTHLLLAFGLILLVAPFLACGFFACGCIGPRFRPNASSYLQHNASNQSSNYASNALTASSNDEEMSSPVVSGGSGRGRPSNSVSSSFNRSVSILATSRSGTTQDRSQLSSSLRALGSNVHNNVRSGSRGSNTSDIQENYLNRRFRSNGNEERGAGDPDAFKRLEDPYFPSQAYEWFWVNPLILLLGILPGLILAILGGVVMGWRGIIPGFGIGLCFAAVGQAWLVWNK